MKLVMGDRAMEVYYWEEDGDSSVDLSELAGTVVTIGAVELVLIPQGLEDATREAILDKVWPRRHDCHD